MIEKQIELRKDKEMIEYQKEQAEKERKLIEEREQAFYLGI